MRFALPFFSLKPARQLVCAALLVATALAITAEKDSTPPTIDLSATPLYTDGLPDKTALVLGLSTGPDSFRAQYPDAVYSPSTDYLGYFEVDSCYRHVTPPDAELPRFERTGAATARGCGGAGFSGNALNWATTATVDIVRLALTGGDRLVDTPALTVLQRAVLPLDAPFPARQLPARFVGDALPAGLRGGPGGALWVHNCLARVRFSPDASSPCADARDGQPAPAQGGPWLDVRVRVCDGDSAGRLQDPRAATLPDPARALCQRYPSGHDKPVGQLQIHGAALRLGLFSHDPQQGARLRARLAEPDDPPEWDTQTGVFAVNPRQAASGWSGVVSELNLAGRASPVATSGRHTGNEALFSEVLRYLQGLPAGRPAPMTGQATPSTRIDSPRTDPYASIDAAQNAACFRQDVLLIQGDSGDARTRTASRRPAASPGDQTADRQAWAAVVRAFESGQEPGVRYLDGQGLPRVTRNPGAAASVPAPDDVYALAGLSYQAHTQDIRGSTLTDASRRRPGLRLATHVLDLTPAGARRAPNPLALSAKYGGFRDASGQGNPFIDRNGAPDNSSWQRPDAPGQAADHVPADNTRELLQSLARLFDEFGRRTAGALTSQRLAGPDMLYEASFDPGHWSGDVVATPLATAAATPTVTATAGSGPPGWSAAARLNQRSSATRNIVVGKTKASPQATATAFLWTAIDADLRAALNRASAGAPEDGRGEERLAYLRGEQASEDASASGPALRRRDSRLGAIVHSGIVRSAEPFASLGDAGYAAFHAAHRARAPAVFVGANDGMLHAFHAATGEELFAYIPAWLGPGLPALTDAQAGSRLPAFVDATPAVAVAEVGPQWKTVLVGGTGAGGQGVYALDVTEPGQFSPGQVLWEFTDRDDATLGQVISAPQVRKFRISAPTAAVPVYKWFAVVAGGVNHYAADAHPSPQIHPALFLLDLSKLAGAAWREGINYYKVVLPADAGAAGRPTGVAGFDVALGPAREVVALYAGDLHGRLWKLDFTQAAASRAAWSLDKLSAFSTPAGPLPLFVARDADGVAQPITAAPFLAAGPGRTTMVVFGTGQYLERTDNTVTARTQRQSVYALYDDDSATPDRQPPGSGAISGRARLQRGLVDADGAVSMPAFTPGRAASDADAALRSGWYIDLPGPGERQTSPARTVGRTLVFSSLLPPPARQACSTGSGRLYRVDVFTGQGQSTPTAVGLPGEPLLVPDGDAALTAPDGTGRRTATRSTRVVAQGARGIADTGTVTRQVRLGRLSWRQIQNYQETRNAP